MPFASVKTGFNHNKKSFLPIKFPKECIFSEKKDFFTILRMAEFSCVEKGELVTVKKYDKNLIDRSMLFVESYFKTGRKSKIVTKDGVFYSRDSVLTLIDKACMIFASTYEGRVKATRHNLKQHQKTTLLISDDGLAAYPTKSPGKPYCVWISNHHYRLEAIAPNRARILFDEFNVSTEANISIGILQKQQSRMYEMMYFYSNVRECNKS